MYDDNYGIVVYCLLMHNIMQTDQEVAYIVTFIFHSDGRGFKESQREVGVLQGRHDDP